MKIAERILASVELGREAVTNLLLTQGAQFAAVLEAGEKLLACVDAVRSIPLFYTHTETGLTVASEPRRLLSKVPGTIDETSLLEMYHAGYVTGSHTLYEGIHQLQAGHALLYDADTGQLQCWAYHRYVPRLAADAEASLEARVGALGETVDLIFRRAIEKVGDREVYLPLSGGLDSRLVACKLHEHGFTRIKAFTYGPHGNSQSVVARAVATRLGLEWSHIPFDVPRMRDFFQSQERVRYQHFADGLSTLPTMGEFCAFLQLGSDDPTGIVVINGQSGDFICGNHLPLHLLEGGGETRLWEHIREKHFAVRPAGSPGMEPIAARFRDWHRSLRLPTDLEHSLATRHENWEFRERQAKYVVNGQRLYEFLGMDWLLPWWDFELVQFFEEVPLDDYVRRQLLLEYLRRYDYQGLFTADYPVARAFTGLEGSLWEGALRGASRLLGSAPASMRRLAFYRTGYYRSYFQLYPYAEFLRRSRGGRVEPQARAATGLMIDQWFEDAGMLGELPSVLMRTPD